MTQLTLPPMPIIVGSPRSGTTLLRMMLDAHSAIAIPPETGFLLVGRDWTASGDELRELFVRAVTSYPPDAPAWNDFHLSADEFRSRLLDIKPFNLAGGFRLFYQLYAERFHKPRWGDKTPIYCRHIEYLDGLLPEARFIHLVRDGRDVTVSLRRQWFSPGHDIEAHAQYWRENVTDARAQGRRCRHYLEVRYESLIQEPERELRAICAFVEVDFESAMLRYFERAASRLDEHLERRRADGSLLVTRERRIEQQIATTQPPDLARVGAWKAALTAEESRAFEAVAGDVLREFGYPVEDGG